MSKHFGEKRLPRLGTPFSKSDESFGLFCAIRFRKPGHECFAGTRPKESRQPNPAIHSKATIAHCGLEEPKHQNLCFQAGHFSSWLTRPDATDGTTGIVAQRPAVASSKTTEVDEEKNSPGGIRTPDQGIMSPLL
jgi:hypothetical protein